ncbi:MAG: DegT/DnrJ/EryC1/StrS family aminotransferase [Candidatus Paceibacterota bacterium]|jgi:perosamine synthetase
MKIPFFRPQLPNKKEVIKNLAQIYKSKWVSNFGPFCEKFEEKAKEITGAKYVFGVTSADIGLMIALRVLRQIHKDRLHVAVPSFTFASTVNIVRWNECNIYLLDINKDTLCIDSVPTFVDVIIPVHTFGNLIKYKDLGVASHQFVIWDAAHAFGVSGNQKDIQVFSFSGTKLVTSGEGGIITTNDADIAEAIQLARGYGFKNDYNVKFNGINGKISEFNALMGYLSCDLLESALARRQEIVNIYKETLGDSFKYQKVPYKSAYKDFIVMFDKPIVEDIAKRMLANEIETKRYFFPVHMMNAYKDLDNGKLENTEWVYDHSLCLPMYNEMKNKDIVIVAKTFKKLYDNI